VNWHAYCCDLKSHWGGTTRAASQPRIWLRADEINLCWSLARNEPPPNHIGWMHTVVPSTQRRALEYEGRKRRAIIRKPGARIQSMETGFEDDTVRVMSHVSPESVTCGVTVAIFGVLGFLWNDCTCILVVRSMCLEQRQPLNRINGNRTVR